MNKRLKSTLLYLVGAALGASLLYLALAKADFAELWQMMGQARWLPLIGALVVVVLSHWLRAWRWSQLLDASGYPVPTERTFAALMFGYLVNYAVPRLGEVSRCSVLIKTNRTPIATSAGTVVTERLIDVITLALFLGAILLTELQTLAGFFTAASNPLENLNFTYLYLLAAILVLLGLFLIRFRKRLMRLNAVQKLAAFLSKLVSGLLSIRHLGRPVLFGILSVGIWGGYVLSTWLFLQAFPQTEGASLWFAIILNTMGAVGMALPVPGGLGPFHAAITYTMVLYGFTETQGANIALVMHTSQLVLNILMGAVGYGYLLFQQPSAAEIAASEAGE
ncbi:MAG: flippase-like domain-containing protein [Bacteroidetes bacterium]|nr:flippase-like domain-containing protein [Bacteroidota bacterium]